MCVWVWLRLCVCVCDRFFPSRIIWLGFCPLSPFSLLLAALYSACRLMVMWRVWLCVRSSGVIFRSCGASRWHHLPPPPPPKGTPCLIPRFPPLRGPPMYGCALRDRIRHPAQTCKHDHVIYTPHFTLGMKNGPLVIWSQVDSCKYRCECIEAHRGCIKIRSPEPRRGSFRQACDPICSIVWTHASLPALKVSFVVSM